MPPDPPADWIAALPEADRGFATEKGWKSPGEVLAAYRTAQASQPKPWTDALDTDAKGFIESRGIKEPADLWNAYRAAQKLIGAPHDELVRLPKSGATPEELAPLLERLGVPKDAAGYKYDAEKVKVPDDLKPLVESFSPIAKQAGLTVPGAERVVSWFLEQNAAAQAAAETAFTEAQTKAKATVTTEWGTAAPAKLQAVEAFARAMGMSDQDVALLEGAIGTDAVLRKFAEMGEKLGEYKLKEGEGQGGGAGITKAAAQEKLKEIVKDPAYHDRANPKHAALVAEAARLTTVLYGNDPIETSGFGA